MTSEQEELLRNLKDQIHYLMSKYTALKKEFGNLILENEELKTKVSENNKTIEALQMQYSSAKVASGFLVNDENKEVARDEINRIVREIDSCIALLNR